MNSKIFWQSLGVVVLAFAVVFALTSYTAKAPTISTLEGTQNVQVSLSVQGLYESKPVTVTANSSILDLLKIINDTDPLLALQVKKYNDLGTLVESMDGKSNGTEKKYWQYFVNGEMPQVGADKYELRGGEKIEWKFEASQY